VREGDWKLLIQEDGTRVQLYNLAEDLGEKRDVAAQHPEVTKRLSEMVLQWNASLPKPPPAGANAGSAESGVRLATRRSGFRASVRQPDNQDVRGTSSKWAPMDQGTESASWESD
jgi:hypothetical protein